MAIDIQFGTVRETMSCQAASTRIGALARIIAEDQDSDSGSDIWNPD